jgi:DNA-binding NarL/FixJ family response regulator
LVVDDQSHFLSAADAVIGSTAGFSTAATARSGRAALEWLRAGQADLVLMDVRMPGLSGVAVAQEIAELADRPVVILCSSDDHPDIAADPRAHGADAFCCKERLSGRMLHELWSIHGARGRTEASTECR